MNELYFKELVSLLDITMTDDDYLHKRDNYHYPYNISLLSNIVELNLQYTLCQKIVYTLYYRSALILNTLHMKPKEHVMTIMFTISGLMSQKVDLDGLYVFCPKLKYLDIDNDRIYGPIQIRQGYFLMPTEEMIRTIAAKEVKSCGIGERNDLQCLLMSNADKTGPDKIAPILLRNAPNIKHFVLGKKQYDSMTAGDNSSNDIDSIPPNKNWTPVFYSFSAPNLRSLVLDNIPYNQSGSLLTMIQQCPSLEALAICNRYHMDLDFSSLLLSLKSFKYLELARFNLVFEGDTDDPIRLFKKLVERGSVIETILLGPAVPNITCTFLLALTLIRTIKHIRAVIDSNRHLYNKEDDRCLFGELLGRTCIESLTLYGVCYLPQPFLCSLSDLPLLKDIHFNAGTATTSFFRQAMNETPRNVLSVLVNRQGFLDMLYKTSSLKCIVIRCAKDPSNTIIATIKNEKQLLDKYSAKTIDFRGETHVSMWEIRTKII